MLRLAIQQRLERGGSFPGFGALSRVWARRVRLERPLRSPIPVVCVGGATLGGSGKTPLAIACARALAEDRRVVLVGHGYGARPPGAPRFVDARDDVRVVGDEALECVHLGIRVVVARRRQDAIDFAAKHADVLVLDGPLNIWPKRAMLSLLALSGDAPWGSGSCPPLGDLRAPRPVLEAAADVVVHVTKHERSAGAWLDHRLVSYEALARMRIGLATAIARPSRVETFLHKRGIIPTHVVRHADHRPFSLPPGDLDLDLWLTTAKDAPRLRTHHKIAVIDYHLDLPPELRTALLGRL